MQEFALRVCETLVQLDCWGVLLQTELECSAVWVSINPDGGKFHEGNARKNAAAFHGGAEG